MPTAADRVPIVFTGEGSDNVLRFRRKYSASDPELVQRVLDELRRGFPLDDPLIRVDIRGEHTWPIPHPEFDDGRLEFDFPEDVNADIDPLAISVIGRLQANYQRPQEKDVLLRFVCTGLREPIRLFNRG